MEEKSLLEIVEESMAIDNIIIEIDEDFQLLDETEFTLLDETEAFINTTQPKFSVYDAFINNNRAHQNQALKAINEHDRGQILLPTGTGKTRIQVAMIVQDMLVKTQERTSGVYVIASHRLLLNKQLMNELLDLCLQCHLPVNALYVGSDRYDDKEVYAKYFHDIAGHFQGVYTTSKSEIKKFTEETQKAGRHLIIVSTYHSFQKLSSLDSIDICAYDEAHNTTEENFQNNIKQVIPKIKRNYFFTATRKVCSIDGYGMENEEMYGRIITKVSPADMIGAGEIIRPRILTIFLDNDIPTGIVQTNNQHMLVKTIIEAFTKSRQAVKDNSFSPNDIGNKILISAEGSDELNLVQNSPEFQTWCTTNNIHVFSFSSKYGFFIDFQQANRDQTYAAMRNITDKEDAIFLHIDILTEGIDLPSITGVLLMRNLNEIKLFQTLGRALRLTKYDRQRLYAGQVTKEQLIKQFAYLILPLHFETMDTSSMDMKRTIQKVISTYQIPIEEFLPPEEYQSSSEEPENLVTTVESKAQSKQDYPLISIIEDLIITEIKQNLPLDPKERAQTMIQFFEKIGQKNA